MRMHGRLGWNSYTAILVATIFTQTCSCLTAMSANSNTGSAANSLPYSASQTNLASIRKQFLNGNLGEWDETLKTRPTALAAVYGSPLRSTNPTIPDKAGNGSIQSVLNNSSSATDWKEYGTTSNPVPITSLTQYLGPVAALSQLGPPTKPLPFLFYPGGVQNVTVPPGFYKDVLPMLTKAGPVSDAEFAILSQKAAILQADAQLDVPLETVKARTNSEMQGILDTGGQLAQKSFSAGLAELAKPIPNPSSANSGNPAMIKINKMYFAFFLPLAILLLVPGAALSSMQFVMRNAGLLQVGGDNIFSFLQRPLIALFMMAACPLFVGMAIDIGNGMTAAVAAELDEPAILQWFESNTNKLSLAPAPNGITAATAVGIATGTASTSAVVDTAMTASQALKGAVMNTSSALLSNAVQILTVFQLVLVAYLYVMGPLACAMWVYPDSNIVFFRRALGSWLNGIICLVLWKFIWAVILLCIQSRLTWLKEMGGPAGDADWESFMLVAFLTLLAIAPAACFSFNPSSYVDAVLAKAKQMSKGKGAASSLSSMGI